MWKLWNTRTLASLGGQDKIRPLWRQYFQNTQCLIFVVDSSDLNRVAEAGDELYNMLLDEDELVDTVLLVLANKQDLPNAMSTEDIIEELGLHFLNHHWYIQGISAKSGAGLYLLDWLTDNITNKDSSNEEKELLESEIQREVENVLWAGSVYDLHKLYLRYVPLQEEFEHLRNRLKNTEWSNIKLREWIRADLITLGGIGFDVDTLLSRFKAIEEFPPLPEWEVERLCEDPEEPRKEAERLRDDPRKDRNVVDFSIEDVKDIINNIESLLALFTETPEQLHALNYARGPMVTENEVLRELYADVQAAWGPVNEREKLGKAVTGNMKRFYCV